MTETLLNAVVWYVLAPLGGLSVVAGVLFYTLMRAR